MCVLFMFRHGVRRQGSRGSMYPTCGTHVKPMAAPSRALAALSSGESSNGSPAVVRRRPPSLSSGGPDTPLAAVPVRPRLKVGRCVFGGKGLTDLCPFGGGSGYGCSQGEPRFAFGPVRLCSRSFRACSLSSGNILEVACASRRPWTRRGLHKPTRF
jgi:hypothetical protein